MDPDIGTATSGQARINAKRTARAVFWAEERRTVRVVVSAEIEPAFRQHLGTLGQRARIDRRTPTQDRFWLELDVHIPGAPPDAVRAEPVYLTAWQGDRCTPVLDHVEWMDASGRALQSGAAP